MRGTIRRLVIDYGEPPVDIFRDARRMRCLTRNRAALPPELRGLPWKISTEHVGVIERHFGVIFCGEHRAEECERFLVMLAEEGSDEHVEATTMGPGPDRQVSDPSDGLQSEEGQGSRDRSAAVPGEPEAPEEGGARA